MLGSGSRSRPGGTLAHDGSAGTTPVRPLCYLSPTTAYDRGEASQTIRRGAGHPRGPTLASDPSQRPAAEETSV